MTVSSVTQRMGVHYSGNVQMLQSVLGHVSHDVVRTDNEKNGQTTFRIFSAIDAIVDKNLVTLEVSLKRNILWFCICYLQNKIMFQWSADSVNDMFADAVLSVILKCEALQGSRVVPLPVKVDHVRFKVKYLFFSLYNTFLLR